MKKSILLNVFKTILCLAFALTIVSCGENQSRTVASKSVQKGNGNIDSAGTGQWANNQDIFEDLLVVSNLEVSTNPKHPTAKATCNLLFDLKDEYEIELKYLQDLIINNLAHPDDFVDINTRIALIQVETNGILKTIATKVKNCPLQADPGGPTPDPQS
jgi:hypothetical protein